MSALARRALSGSYCAPFATRAFSSPVPQPPPLTSTKPDPSTRPTVLEEMSTAAPAPSGPRVLSVPPQFPAPTDPFDAAEPAPEPKRAEYSEGTKAVVRGVAALMGYNTAASTAIRETGRMMRGIVEAVERDRAFWYDRCDLPPTYQTFFQLHLLYVLILLPRLRTLPASLRASSPVPEPLSASAPHAAEPVKPSAGPTLLGKAAYDAYPGELLGHFFELAESQMRLVLGRNERERVIRKYMDEMGEQWKGAGAGIDYVLGLGVSESAHDRARADAELASWAWRNLFASRGLAPATTVADELKLVEDLEAVVRFTRREMSRLDGIADDDVLSGNIGRWGRPE
ncbi:Serine carboxypeptidase 3 [Cryptotrichosporon argae]